MGEVPIGAVITKDNKILSYAYNSREKDQMATHHAELKAIEKACKKLQSWRLDDCDIYVTLEPCPMCLGAALNARIKNVFYAVKNESYGAVTKSDISNNALNHNISCTHQPEYESENKQLIQTFFQKRRKNN